MSMLANAVFAAALAATGGTSQPQDATLRFVASDSALVGISFGMSAVDGRTLLLDQRTSTHLAAGRRTIWYSCPNEAGMQEGSALSFDFVPGKRYELACRSGLPAQIREAEDC